VSVAGEEEELANLPGSKPRAKQCALSYRMSAAADGNPFHRRSHTCPAITPNTEHRAHIPAPKSSRSQNWKLKPYLTQQQTN